MSGTQGMHAKTMMVDRDLYRSAMEPAPLDVDDRRQEPRYAPVMERAYLGWWEGESFRTELGRLANISAGGAALEVRSDPGVGEVVWLCVIGPNRLGWVPARLLGRNGRIRRMVFAERFPYELFTSVVWGFPAPEPGLPEDALGAQTGGPVGCGLASD